MSNNKKYKFKTSSAKEVRVTLSKLVNLVANKDIDVKTANSIAYLTSYILQSIRVDEQEQQIEELKKILEEIQNDRSKKNDK